MAHTYVKPSRVIIHNTALCTDVSRVYAYKARCSCGWIGNPQDKHGDAQWEARVHRHEEHKQ